jgi:hypothetical protein
MVIARELQFELPLFVNVSATVEGGVNDAVIENCFCASAALGAIAIAARINITERPKNLRIVFMTSPNALTSKK